MSGYAARPSRDEDATSMISSQAYKSSWMSRWINGSSNSGPAVDNSSLIGCKGEHIDNKGSLMQSGLKIEYGLPYGKGVCNSDDNMKGLTMKARDSGKKLSNFPFSTLGLSKNKEKASTVGTQGDHDLGHKTMSLALAVCKGGSSRDLSLRGNDQQVISQLCQDSKGMAASRPCKYNKSDASKPVVVFERHFSNDNFTCFSQESCKYQKSSSVLFHEKQMGNDLCRVSGLSDGLQHGAGAGKKNFQSFFVKKQTHDVPCSFRNVETMRICTMVDSVENSPGDPPKISQRAHHILFTKETCVNMSKPNIGSHSRGVKIQPLWTSTDSEEKENTGNPSICKDSSRNEASVETDGMQVELRSVHTEEKKLGGSFNLYSNVTSNSRGVKIQPLQASIDGEEKENTGIPSTSKAGLRYEASAETDGMRVHPKNQFILLGMESSPLTKDGTVDYTSAPAVCDSSTEKSRSKRPINEIPDINEEVTGLQPAVSSTDRNEASTSRVHSLNAKQLFSCNEEYSRPECKARPECSVGQDTGSRWIKRLKLNTSDSFGVGTNSSDVGEGSSHDKFSMFFNRITKCNRESYDAKLQKHHGKEQVEIDQNVESLSNGEPSSTCSRKRKINTMRGCTWIQRWCQSSTASPSSNPEPLVICEPHNLKVGQEELAKKQFPSIAAMALMGKAMNGFQSCEFKKRGPVVIWNTKEY